MANALNVLFIEQTTLENDEDPYRKSTFLDCEINGLYLTEFEVKEIIKNFKNR